MAAQMVSISASRRDWPIALGFALLTLVTRYAFLCRGGTGDPDSVAIAAGLAQWVGSHGNFGDAFLYGRQVNPGVYFLFKFIYPIFYHDSSHVIGFLNAFNLVCASLLGAALYFAARKLFDRRVASGFCLIVLSSPLVWEIETYFHPTVPAALFLFLSYLAWGRTKATPSGVGFYILACVLFAAALIVRIDVIFIIPALIAGALVSSTGRMKKALFFGILLVAAICYAAVLKSVPRQTAPAESASVHVGLPRYVWERIVEYVSWARPAAIARTSVWASFGIGVATCLLGLYAIASVLIRRARPSVGLPAGRLPSVNGRALLVAVIWMLPSLLYWLPVPVSIVRHYFFVTLGASWLVGEMVLRDAPARRMASLVGAIVVLNLVVPEIVYGSYNARHPGSTKYPNGSFFLGHRAIEQRISRYQSLQTKFLAALRGKEGPRGVFIAGNWETYGYVNYAMAQAGRFERPPTLAVEQGVATRTYWIDGREIRLALVNWYTDSPALRALYEDVAQAENDGFAVFVPVEITRLGVSRDLPNSLVSY